MKRALSVKVLKPNENLLFNLCCFFKGEYFILLLCLLRQEIASITVLHYYFNIVLIFRKRFEFDDMIRLNIFHPLYIDIEVCSLYWMFFQNSCWDFFHSEQVTLLIFDEISIPKGSPSQSSFLFVLWAIEGVVGCKTNILFTLHLPCDINIVSKSRLRQ